MVHKGWWEAGHGDSRIALEDFVQCSDGQFHRIDHCGHILPTRLQLLDMTPEGNEQRAWGSSSVAAAGGDAEEEREGGGGEEGDSGGDSSATALGSTAEQQKTKEKVPSYLSLYLPSSSPLTPYNPPPPPHLSPLSPPIS